MHMTHYYFYICIVFSIYSTEYGAAESLPSSSNASTQQMVAELQKICSSLTVSSSSIEEMLTYVSNLKSLQNGMLQPLRVPEKIITIKQQSTHLLDVSSREEMLTPLSYALLKSAYFFAHLIAHAIPEYIFIPDSQNNTPLHYLCESLERKNFMQSVNKITRGIIDTCKPIINHQNRSGITPIMIATDPRLIAALCMHGANIHHTNNLGQTALSYDHQAYPKNYKSKLSTHVLLGANPQTMRTQDRLAYQEHHHKKIASIRYIIEQERIYSIASAALPYTSIIHKLHSREHNRLK